MARDDASVVYWDSSAILSTLFEDVHSERAQAWMKEKRFHLMSTLAYAEICAVIARMKRERHLTAILAQAAQEAFQQGPWHRLTAWPEWEAVQALCWKWPLRGADLWHLALAFGLKKDLPELCLLTFDSRLKSAAEGAGMSCS